MKQTFIMSAVVEYDDDTTDPAGLCAAFGMVLDAAMSAGTLDEHGAVDVGPFCAAHLIAPAESSGHDRGGPAD